MTCTCGDVAGLVTRALGGEPDPGCPAHRPEQPVEGPTLALNDDPGLIQAIRAAFRGTTKETHDA
jgi:hypothetical protein